MKTLLSLLATPLATMGLVTIVDSTSFRVNPSMIAKTGIVYCDTVKVILEKTSFKDMTVLYISDTAQTTAAISEVLSKGYGELMRYAGEKKVQPVKFMAWYYAMQPPWQMDIAIETNRMDSELSGRIKSRVQQGGEVLIAHMWGPYDKVGQAYLKIENWMNDNKRKAKGNPFEVYLNDPSAVKSPSEIRTDIYQPIE